ncbi:MAG: hypothetical protein Q9M34_03545 [Sulfurimonas sp.]|nr:hypothetical protein [Sulfurimonas sp.]
MNKYLLKAVLISGLFITPIYAETATAESVAALQKSIDTLSLTVTQQQQLVSKLSDDIGLMADRIGTMADRIVVTENLLADTLTTLTGNADLTGGSSSDGVALTAPTDSSPKLSRTVAPTIAMTPDATVYLLYASSEPTFSPATTIALYVDSTTTLSDKWSQVVDFYDSTTSTNFYLAVKRIDGGTKISSISNGVKVSF